MNLNEDYKSINELTNLANDFINAFTEKNYPLVNRINKRNVKDYYLNYNMINIEDAVVKKENYDVLEDFIGLRNRPLWVIVSDNIRYSHYSGNDNIIRLKNDGERFKELLDFQIKFANKNPDDNSIDAEDAKRMLNSILGTLFRSTLVHELQHAYDHFRSNGKYANDKKSKKYYKNYNVLNDDMSHKKFLEYVKLPHEYWARFAQFISDRYYFKEDFKTLLLHFKESSRIKYYLLPDKDKKILIKALYKYWYLKQQENEN